MKLSDLLYCTADYAVQLQCSSGSFPPGVNGPYNQPETPVRNTAHLLFLIASLYEQSGEKKYKDAGLKAVKYLLSESARPNKKTYLCRSNGIDRCNGLIGQAWVIEALTKASQVFDDDNCYQLAEELFFLHPWNSKVGIWHRVEADGKVLYYDNTFNHQLWFAAAASLFEYTPEAQRRSLYFLENVAKRVCLYRDNVIVHVSPMGRLDQHILNGPKETLRTLRFRREFAKVKNSYYKKSIGYHAFNLYALAILKEMFPASSAWNSKSITKLLSAHKRNTFLENSKKTELAFRYNLTGIELAYAEEVFLKDAEEATFWLKRQLDETNINSEKGGWLSRGVKDHSTAIARSYEACRLKSDYELNLY